MILEQILRTEIMLLANCGRREDVYAFVAKIIFWAKREPRGVQMVQYPEGEQEEDVCVTGV
jgi:hypothetical protein